MCNEKHERQMSCYVDVVQNRIVSYSWECNVHRGILLITVPYLYIPILFLHWGLNGLLLVSLQSLKHLIYM